MTIKEAVEEYERINRKISEINVTKRDICIKNQNPSPLGYFELTREQIGDIFRWLDEYKEMIEQGLNAEFNPKSTYTLKE